MSKLLEFIGLEPSDREKQTLENLKEHGNSSMKVVGRGTLTMSEREAKKSPAYRELAERASEILS